MEWASMRGPERSTISMALHIHIYAHSCYSLSPRWALHLYTYLPLSYKSFFTSRLVGNADIV